MRLDDLGAWIAITVFFFLVLGILTMLVRFWGECRHDVAVAKERITWPTDTVEATLYDVTLRARRAGRPLSAYGQYRFEYGGKEHETEQHEIVLGSDEEIRQKAEELKAEGKTVDLPIQYNPLDPSEVHTEITTRVPNCTPWIGGFLVLFSGILLLLLRGYYRLLLR